MSWLNTSNIILSDNKPTSSIQILHASLNGRGQQFFRCPSINFNNCPWFVVRNTSSPSYMVSDWPNGTSLIRMNVTIGMYTLGISGISWIWFWGCEIQVHLVNTFSPSLVTCSLVPMATVSSLSRPHQKRLNSSTGGLFKESITFIVSTVIFSNLGSYRAKTTQPSTAQQTAGPSIKWNSICDFPVLLTSKLPIIINES